jgi:hypothetical protein
MNNGEVSNLFRVGLFGFICKQNRTAYNHYGNAVRQSGGLHLQSNGRMRRHSKRPDGHEAGGVAERQ